MQFFFYIMYCIGDETAAATEAAVFFLLLLVSSVLLLIWLSWSVLIVHCLNAVSQSLMKLTVDLQIVSSCG